MPVAPATTVLADYQYQWANAALNRNHAHQVGLTLDYAFSRRTDTYLGAVYQRGSGTGAAAWIRVDDRLRQQEPGAGTSRDPACLLTVNDSVFPQCAARIRCV